MFGAGMLKLPVLIGAQRSTSPPLRVTYAQPSISVTGKLVVWLMIAPLIVPVVCSTEKSIVAD